MVQNVRDKIDFCWRQIDLVEKVKAMRDKSYLQWPSQN